MILCNCFKKFYFLLLALDHGSSFALFLQALQVYKVLLWMKVLGSYTWPHWLHKYANFIILVFLFIIRLDPDRKNSEILRLLPLLGPFAQDFAGIHSKLNKAFVKLEDIDTIKNVLNNQNKNKNNNNNYIEDLHLQSNPSASFLPDDNSSYSYLSK